MPALHLRSSIMTSHTRETRLRSGRAPRKNASVADPRVPAAPLTLDEFAVALAALAHFEAPPFLAAARLLRRRLGVAKQRLLAFLQAEGQPFITDPSNSDPAFARSRLRRGDRAMPGAAEAPAVLAAIHSLGSSRLARERGRSALLG